MPEDDQTIIVLQRLLGSTGLTCASDALLKEAYREAIVVCSAQRGLLTSQGTASPAHSPRETRFKAYGGWSKR